MPSITDLGGGQPTAHTNASQPSTIAPPALHSVASTVPTYERPTATTPAPPADRDAADATLRYELDRLRRELDDSHSALAERDSQLAAARTEAASARLGQRQATPAQVESTGAANARRLRAMNAAGGNAKYHALPIAERFALLGMTPPSQDEVAEAKQFFGRESSSALAQGLSRANPGKYSRLRHVARESGIL